MRSWNDTIALHDDAVARFVDSAAHVTSWDVAPGPKKWTAAEITEHLILAFRAVIAEMEGGPPMKLRTRPMQRFILRFTIQRRLMRGGAFPNGAPAPRETRPRAIRQPKDEAIAELSRLGRALSAGASVARERNPDIRMMHPYFGYVPLVDGLYISARHIEHHRTQIMGR